MRIKSILLLLVCFLLSGFTMPAIACPPPYCGSCCHWEGPVPGGSCQLNTGADCGDCSGCGGECYTCSGCWCLDDESKCSGCKRCSVGTCVDADHKCSWRFCQDCNDGECEDRCPALGKHCDSDTGSCEECVDVLHCELCEECIFHKCVHPCDDCDPPKYCGSACACVECEYVEEEEDTTTCSTANNTTECDCSINIINPCSSAEESVSYSGNFLKSCTGPNCGSDNVLCYTTYQSCTTSGSYQPLHLCIGNDVGPPPPAPWPSSCTLNLDIPGPGCYTCANSFSAGVPTYESQGDCPIELWPE